MSAIKKCTRCNKTVPHHSDVDNICMQCEMELYYPDDKMAFHIGALKANAYAMEAINIAQDTLEKTNDILNERRSILGRIIKWL